MIHVALSFEVSLARVNLRHEVTNTDPLPKIFWFHSFTGNGRFFVYKSGLRCPVLYGSENAFHTPSQRQPAETKTTEFVNESFRSGRNEVIINLWIDCRLETGLGHNSAKSVVVCGWEFGFWGDANTRDRNGLGCRWLKLIGRVLISLPWPGLGNVMVWSWKVCFR